jgi:4-amino-4-deoxy-L-arabinose transferase-like glycosyltransferase
VITAQDKLMKKDTAAHSVAPGGTLSAGSHRLRSPAKGLLIEALVFVLAALLVRATWIFLVPVSDAPDEPCHIWVSQFLAEHARLPHVKDVLDGGFAAVYGPMPQMGYILHALAGKCLSGLTSSPSVYRVGSLLAGLVSIVAAWAIGRELFPKERLARWALPSLMVFHPQLVFVHSYTNNDATVSALGAAITYAGILFIKRGLSPGVAASLGVLLGWLALSKFSAYALFAGAGFAFIAGAVLHRSTLKSLLLSAALAMFSCVGTCSWWFLRQMHEYPGDFLGTVNAHKIWLDYRHIPPSKADFWLVLQTPLYWQILAKSYLGVFGYMKRYMYEFVYTLYGCFGIAAIIGAGFKIASSAFDRASTLNKSQPEIVEQRETLAVIASSIVCLVPTVLAITYAACNNFPVQGRYLLGVEVPILLLVIFGLRGFGRRVGNIAIGSLAVFNFASWVGATFMLYSAYISQQVK